MVIQREANRQLIQQRLKRFRTPVLLIFMVLAVRLWQLQIIQGSEYARKAERNRIRKIELTAPRGTILDRNGIALVENRSSFNVLLYRESITDFAETTRFLTEKLGIKPEDLQARLRRAQNTALYHPVVVKEDAGIDDISVIEAHRREHPEVQLGPQPRRLYHYGNTAAHLLGYVGEVSEQDLKNNVFPGARPGSLVGQSGVERSYNRILTGKDGERRVLVDSLGREVGFLSETPAVIGGEVQLTIDLDLQIAAERALQDKVGAIVVMDPRNGEILAMASSPSYDPNAFASRLSEAEWNYLLNHLDRPMQNRAIQNSYSPGSIFKLIVAEAGLQEGLLKDNPAVICHGSAAYYGRIFHCASEGGHGALDLEEAIAKSCNIFFYELGRRLGISRIARHARALGLGEPTGIDLPGERSGLMPTPEWKLQTKRTKWFPGETISVSIGQGAVSVTPLQVVRAIGAIATGGLLVTPHVLLRAEGGAQAGIQWPVRRIPIAEANARRIREGMWRSVNDYGTGHNAALPGLDICGKTGTVQRMSPDTTQMVGPKIENHSWFAGFAGFDHQT